MIKNYLKTAIRTLQKNKGFTAINILGLALGIATCLLIVFYVVDELSYDKFNQRAGRIYRINNDIKFGGNERSYASSPAPLYNILVKNYPSVEKVVRLRTRGPFNVKKGSQNIPEYGFIFADSTLFDVFTLPMVAGEPKTALTEPNCVVISEKVAKRYFNSTQIVGKTLTFNDSLLYKVTGVIKDMPEQSHFRYDFFLSMSTNPESREDAWFSNNFNTYVLLKEGADPAALQAAFPQLLRKYAGPQLESILHLNFNDFEAAGNFYKLNLIALTDIHLRSNTISDLRANGNIQYVQIFSYAAIFILLIACVNFMNLSTARSSNRAREVGVRKVLGSPRKYLIAQFLSESVIITSIAAIIAIAAAALLLPLFNQMSGKELAITPAVLSWLIPSVLVSVLVIGCLAGWYPALYLSGFQPIQVLKGKLSTGFKSGWLRSSLVVFQFFISIVLIIATLVIYNQLKYIQQKDLGYSREQVVIVQHLNDLGGKSEVFKQSVKQLAGIKGVTMSGFLPTAYYRNSSTLFLTPTLDQTKAVATQTWQVDEDYISTLGIKLVKGRNFSKDMPTDSSALIINESAAKLMNVKDPIGLTAYLPQDNLVKVVKSYHIIGVIKDFNFSSLKDNITPVILGLGNDNGALCVKASTANMKTLLAQMKDEWKKVSPNTQFDYSFMDDDFDAAYRTEQRMGSIFIAFTTLAIIIAGLGLFGLAAYAAEQRTKEIGIRKVMGASVSLIVAMLSKDFIKLVVMAIIIATPLAWYAMQKWFLQSYAYRQDVQWWVLVLAAGLALVIAFVTISLQSLKAALANPIKSLRSE